MEEPRSSITEGPIQDPARPQRTDGCFGTFSYAAEGEVLINFYENGVRACNPPSVQLEPISGGAGTGGLIDADPDYQWMGEWWDRQAGTGNDGPCQSDRSSIPNEITHELHYPEDFNTLEAHCISPGSFTVSAGGFDVDYLDASVGNISNTTVFGDTRIEVVEDRDPLVTNLTHDLIFHIDAASFTSTNIPKLEIQNSGSNPDANPFTDQSSPSGSASDWFRFSVARSTTSWSGAVGARGRLLAMLFWDYTNNVNDRTNYYDASPSPSWIIRVHQFTGASGCRVVGLGLKSPDQPPALIADTTRRVAISGTCPSGVDLFPMPLSLSQSAIANGATVDMKVREHNVGSSSAAGGWNRKFYLSSNATCCSGDVAFGPYTESSAIAAGGDKDITQAIAVTMPTPGTYYVFVKLDDGNTVSEIDENNNPQMFPTLLTISGPPPVPDITPNPVTPDRTTVSQFSSLAVTVRESNPGTASMPAGWAGKLYLSTNTACCSGDVLLQTYTEANTIAAGQYRDNVRTVTIPSNTAWGTYYVLAHLDANGAIAESNEGNNIAASVQVTVGPCQYNLSPPGGEWDVGETATMVPVIAANCASRYITILPAAGIAGFTTQPNCTATTFNHTSANPVVRACANGVAPVKVYRIQGGTLEQQFSIGVGQL